MVNATIRELKENGGYDELVTAFMPSDGNITVPPLKSVSLSGSLNLGVGAAFLSFGYVRANKKIIVIDMAFDSLIPALQAGKIDVIAAGMSVTKERKKNVNFSIPYYVSGQVIIIKK